MAKPKRAAPTFKTDKALFVALASNDYSTRSAAQEHVIAMLGALAPDAAVARVKALADAALTSAPKIAKAVGHKILPPLVKLGVAIPRTYDPLISGYGVIAELRDVLSSLPEDRRIAILRREVLGDDGMASGRVRESLLDLIPKTARAEILAALKNQERAARAKAPPPPPPVPREPGPFTFQEPSAFWPEKYGELDAIDKAQFRAAGAAYMGGIVKTGEHFIKRLPSQELDASDREWRRWKVLRDDSHEYDVWVFWVDNATVFPARKTERAPVQMVQGSWQPLKQNTKAKTLADEMERSAPRDLWTLSKVNLKKPTTKKQHPTKKARASR